MPQSEETRLAILALQEGQVRSSRMRRWAYAAVALAVALICLLGWQNYNVVSRLQVSQEQRNVIIDKLDDQQRGLLCFSQTQSSWDSAITDLLQEGIGREGTTPSPELEDRIKRLVEITRQLDQSRSSCLAETP